MFSFSLSSLSPFSSSSRSPLFSFAVFILLFLCDNIAFSSSLSGHQKLTPTQFPINNEPKKEIPVFTTTSGHNPPRARRGAGNENSNRLSGLDNLASKYNAQGAKIQPQFKPTPTQKIDPTKLNLPYNYDATKTQFNKEAPLPNQQRIPTQTFQNQRPNTPTATQKQPLGQAQPTQQQRQFTGTPNTNTGGRQPLTATQNLGSNSQFGSHNVQGLHNMGHGGPTITQTVGSGNPTKGLHKNFMGGNKWKEQQKADKAAKRAQRDAEKKMQEFIKQQKRQQKELEKKQKQEKQKAAKLRREALAKAQEAGPKLAKVTSNTRPQQHTYRPTATQTAQNYNYVKGPTPTQRQQPEPEIPPPPATTFSNKDHRKAVIESVRTRQAPLNDIDKADYWARLEALTEVEKDVEERKLWDSMSDADRLNIIQRADNLNKLADQTRKKLAQTMHSVMEELLPEGEEDQKRHRIAALAHEEAIHGMGLDEMRDYRAAIRGKVRDDLGAHINAASQRHYAVLSPEQLQRLEWKLAQRDEL